jgi:hypothetical protein
MQWLSCKVSLPRTHLPASLAMTCVATASPCCFPHFRRFRPPLVVLRRCACLLFLSAMLLAAGPRQEGRADEPKVDYARDVQPILTNHCWSCHGPDEQARQADLRLDLRDPAIASGSIVPQDPTRSVLIERIEHQDAELIMPPPETKRPLTARQREVLRQWISEGALYANHWSFQPPTSPSLPALSSPNTESARNWESPIDRFVLNRLQTEGLAPAPSADRATLLRRVTLDLTGLPPTLPEQEAFLADPNSDAYEKVVDRLLGSTAYAERMTAHWLDLSRYADTNGYNNDEDRSMWPWRDWVIHAFDSNMPYDQFLIEQLAGDLLPDASLSQKIATGFLRNQGHNTEGGIIAEEYRVEYVADRVHTAATVFLGLSMQCARCHDHKYDPVSQNEYYRFFALFNNLEEKQASYSNFVGAEPFVRVPSEEQSQRLDSLTAELESLQKQLAAHEEGVPRRFADWLKQQGDNELASRWNVRGTHALPLDQPMATADPNRFTNIDTLDPAIVGQAIGPIGWVEGHRAQAVALRGQSHLDLGSLGNVTGAEPFAISVWVRPQSGHAGAMAILSKMDEPAAFRGYDLLLEGGKLAVHLVHHWPDNAMKVTSQSTLTPDVWHHVVLAVDGSNKASGVQLYIDGQPSKLDVNTDQLSGTLATDKPFHLGLRGTSLPFHGEVDDLKFFAGPMSTEQVNALFLELPLPQVTDWIRKPWGELPTEQQSFLKRFTLRELVPEYGACKKSYDDQKKERENLESQLPVVMVMKDMEPARETFVLKRGQYDQPADRVQAGVPSVLLTDPNRQPTNRLEFARWLTHRDNPLAARVVVNRVWESLFGCGLVKTSEDFGVTGEFPSHPQLLDYLANQFVEQGWNIKALHKEIAMTQTYRQDSRIESSAWTRDPENRLLARGSRYRLSAETIRDNALAISGLLQRRIGGPSVKPYQPEGLWEDVTVERRGKYVADQGEALFRRSMYTFWKRTCPPPSMVSFDAPNREVCIARRSRTNTPLQSLVLLNDPTYVEAARALAQDMIRSGGDDDIARIHLGYRRAVARPARPEELPVMLDLIRVARSRFAEQPQDASELNRVGTLPLDSGLEAVEVAAWTVVASTLLNLDETITKR